MRLERSLQRLASAGLAVLVFVSSLTCMTVACKVVCAAEAGSMAAAAASDLPPCHRPAQGGSSTAPPSAPRGDCGSGSVCCSTWLHDPDVYRMPAPILVRASLADDVPALLPVAGSVPAAADAFVLLAGANPPDPCVPLLPSPRDSRAPPAA